MSLLCQKNNLSYYTSKTFEGANQSAEGNSAAIAGQSAEGKDAAGGCCFQFNQFFSQRNVIYQLNKRAGMNQSAEGKSAVSASYSAKGKSATYQNFQNHVSA